MNIRIRGAFDVAMNPQPLHAEAAGTPQLRITVVPDAGTGALRGLAGQTAVRIDDQRQRHRHDFGVTMP